MKRQHTEGRPEAPKKAYRQFKADEKALKAAEALTEEKREEAAEHLQALLEAAFKEGGEYMNFYRSKDNSGAILTEDQARSQWAEGHSGEDPKSFYDQYERVAGNEAVIADVKNIIATSGPTDKFKYMLLDRLRADCEYFLGAGNRHAAHLWAHAVEPQIEAMLLLWDSFPEDSRPEWITREQIEEYRAEMSPQKKEKPQPTEGD